jgi:hypothetical protein
MTINIFEHCQEQIPGGNMTQMMQCVSDSLQEEEEARLLDLQDFLFVLAGAMIFFMQSGFAMLCAGSVRVKNVQNTMLKNLLDACGAALAFYLVGEWRIYRMDVLWRLWLSLVALSRRVNASYDFLLFRNCSSLVVRICTRVRWSK